MTPERFHAQINRVSHIAERLFPSCEMHHSADNMPYSFSFELYDSNDRRIAVFPSHSVEAYENSSPKMIEDLIKKNVERWRRIVAGEIEGF